MNNVLNNNESHFSQIIPYNLIIKGLLTGFVVLFTVPKIVRGYTNISNLYHKYQEITIESKLQENNQKTSNHFKDIISHEIAPKLFQHIINSIESKAKLTTLKELIAQNIHKENLHIHWNNFKEKTLYGFYTTFIVFRYFLLISITNMLLYQKKKSQFDIASIFNEHWNMLINSLEKILIYFESIINEEAETINLKTKVTKEQFQLLLKRIFDKIIVIEQKINENSLILKFHEIYVKDIEIQINKNEENPYDHTNYKTMEQIDNNLRFDKSYYDILKSHYFFHILLTYLNQDYDFLLNQLEVTSNQEISIAKYILWLDQIRMTMVDYDKTHLIKGSNQEDLLIDEYCNILKEI